MTIPITFIVIAARAGFSVLDWTDYIKSSGGSAYIPNYALHVLRNEAHNEYGGTMICPLEDEDRTMKDGIFEHFQNEMLAAEYTLRSKDVRETRLWIEAAHEMGRPWSMRSFSNRGKTYLTFSFQDVPRVIEFRLRI